VIELQRYLHENGLVRLEEEFKISSRRHEDYNNLICLKYSQIESPMGSKIAQQCRGIILDEDNDWSIVSYPYDKFFNYGEGHAASLDWNTSQVYEKLDGSLMTLYHYRNQWLVQSSGTADAAGNVNGFKFTFADLFWKVWSEKQYSLPTKTNFCYMFELCTKFNRVVVPHYENRLIVHGVRNVVTCQEHHLDAIEQQGLDWEVVKTVPFKEASVLVEDSLAINPMQSEGYVVCDRNFQRVKIKSPQYVAIAHLRDGFSPRRLLSIVVTNEGAEFLNYYPEWQDSYDEVKEKFESLVSEIEDDYAKSRHIENQKEFALAINHLPYCGVLFSLRSGKSKTAREHLKNSTIQSLENLLGMKSKE